MSTQQNNSGHVAVPAESATDTRVCDTDKRAAYEKWAAECERLSMFGPGNFSNKITWSAYRAGIAYQVGCNKDTAMLAAYRKLIHTHHPAPDGSEFGVCHVRHDDSGRLVSCFWATHDEVDAAVAALVEVESGSAAKVCTSPAVTDERILELATKHCIAAWMLSPPNEHWKSPKDSVMAFAREIERAALAAQSGINLDLPPAK